MSFLKKILPVLFLTIQTLLNADTVSISNCEMVKVDVNQIMITEQGCYIIHESSSQPIPVTGFVNQNNQHYAIIVPSHRVEALCGHRYGCKICRGCIQSGCWNYCSGCK